MRCARDACASRSAREFAAERAHTATRARRARSDAPMRSSARTAALGERARARATRAGGMCARRVDARGRVDVISARRATPSDACARGDGFGRARVVSARVVLAPGGRAVSWRARGAGDGSRRALSVLARGRRRSRVVDETLEDETRASGEYFQAGDVALDGPIPPPPRTSDLVDVMPYLFAVSLSRRGTAWRLFGAIAFLVIQKSFGLAVPILFKVAVDHCTAAATMSGSAAAQAARAAAWALVASGCLKAMSGVATEVRTVLFTPVAQASGRRVALEVFNHVLGLDLSFHLERRTGALQRIIDRGTRSVSMVFRAVVFTFLPTAIELALVCGLLWHAFSWHFVVIVLTTFVFYVWWTMYMTGVSAEKRKLANHMDGLSTGKAVDALLNYETVTFFGNVDLESQQYDNLLRGYHEAALKSERASSLLNAGQAVILACGMTSILAFAALGLWKVDPAAGLASRVGDLVMANGLLLQLWAPLQFLGFFYRELRQSLVDMEAMFDIMATESKIPDGAVELPENAGGAELELEDVTFSYGDGREVLRGVSLKLKPGESVGIVGPSGSGKSTLLRLILRVYDVTSGKVKIDGYDLRDLTLSSLRSSVAVIPQDTVLFNDTLDHNIRYGRPNASDDEVAMAATRARLDKTIELMPKGRLTMVGERGVKLSGGEKQRVAIARAFLREPRMLVADEATSALDTATEQGILESLEDVARGRTAVFVAHRLSTVRSCDRIIVMEQGRIVEEGTHAELLDCRGRGEKIGMYAAMWKAQAQEEEKEKEKNVKPDDLVATVG